MRVLRFIKTICVFVLFGYHIQVFSQSIWTLYWPFVTNGDYTRNDVTCAFGPRDNTSANGWFHVGLDVQHQPSGADIWDLRNPYNENARVTLYGGSGDVQWFTLAPVNQSSSNPVKKCIFWHVENSTLPSDYLTKSYSSEQLLPIKMKDLDPKNFPDHGHLETAITQDLYYDQTGRPQDPYWSRYTQTRNPLQWLNHDASSSNIGGSWYFFNIAWAGPGTYKRYVGWKTGSESTTDGTLNYLMVRVGQHKYCLNFNRVTVNVSGIPSYSWKGQSNFYDLNMRDGPALLRELANNPGTRSGYNNKYYKGAKIYAPNWAMTSDVPKVVEYYFYLPAGQTFDGRTVAITVEDVDGGKYVSDTYTIPSCTGCQPPPNVSRPPTWLTATTVANGIRLEWPSDAPDAGISQVGFLIYRRDAATPDISCAQSLILVDKNSAPTQTYIDVLGGGNPAAAGKQYKYSIATVTTAGEGCNGPFESTNCNDWQTYGCSSCAVREAAAFMPSANTQTGILSGTTTLNGAVPIIDATVNSGESYSVTSNSEYRIMPETRFYAGSTVSLKLTGMGKSQANGYVNGDEGKLNQSSFQNAFASDLKIIQKDATVRLQFQLQNEMDVSLAIFGLNGRRLLERNYGKLPVGEFVEVIPVKEITSGCNIIVVHAGRQVWKTKIITLH